MAQDQQLQQYSLPVTSDELYANAIQTENIRNIVSQINPDQQLKEIEMRIRGYKKDVFTGDWVLIDPDTPEPPRLLVSRFVSYLSSIMNQNTTQSNLSDRQINALMGQAISYIVDELDGNAKLYDLENNYTERTRIGHIILNSMFMVLNRALNGQEAKRMWKSMSLSENSSNQEKQSNKLMEALKVWK